MPKNFIKHILVILFMHATFFGFAQNTKPFKISKVGTPLMKVYSENSEITSRSSYAIDQDTKGMLYVANSGGIIRFDGIHWDTFMTEVPDGITGVTAGNDGRIYGVSRGEYGYLKPNAKGEYEYHSLTARTTDLVTDPGTFYYIDKVGDDIVYWSFTDLIIYQPETDSITIKSADKFSRGIRVGKDYYLMDYSQGLMQLKNRQLKAAPISEQFLGLTIVDMVPFSDDQLLVITQDQGLFLYDSNSLNKFETEIGEFLSTSSPFTATSIKNQYFAIGSRNEGIVIIDKEGRLIQKINEAMGLSAGAVWDLMLDRENNLWVMTVSGISQIILNSPFTLIDERHGVTGGVNQIKKHKNKVYISTTEGLFYKAEGAPWQGLDAYTPFKVIKGNVKSAYVLESKGDRLLMASTHGIYEVIGESVKTVHKGQSYWAGVGLKNSDDIILGSYQGNLSLVRKMGNGFRFIKKFEGFAHQIDFIQESDEGDIWVTDSEAGVFKVVLSKDNEEILSVKSYDTLQGLPSLDGNRVYRANNELVFATNNGIYEYDRTKDLFVPKKELTEALEGGYVTRFAEANDGTVFISGGKGKGLLRKVNGSFEFQRTPFQQLDEFSTQHATALGTDNFWIGSDVIHHYDPTGNFKPVGTFNAHIGSIKVLTKNDSLLFGGVGLSSVPKLNIQENGLEFNYAGLYYEFPEQTNFQSYMEGFEEDWSDWTFKSSRQFFNLKPGAYNFKLRARNVYGQESKIAEFRFVILTPWYLKWWAYALYALAVILVVRAIVKINVNRLEKDKLALEQTITDRTKEIRYQKDEIEKQANKLRALDKVKSRFFANISHELRTPLTLINAPLETLLYNDKINDPEIRQTLAIAIRNGVSLLSLVEEILDLAKLDGGKLKLIENPVRVKNFIELVLAGYKNGFDQKAISVEYKFYPKDDLTILIDENRCTKIINNLLSNALKFTGQGGAIRVVVDEDIEEDTLSIQVKDSGIGIHPSDLPYVFDRYYQSDQPSRKAEGGTGIGLALAKELATLHAGSLTVESELGKGANFTLILPVKEVFEETIVMLAAFESEALEIALNETIINYSAKFELDKPVLLITEDHFEMRAFIAKTLMPYFDIKQAENGEVALKILRSQRIDIVISDVMMPVMDGFELLEAIKKDKSLHQVSVIMLTARADHDDKLYALTLGIDDYLTKPFHASEFLARIKNILENRIKIIRKINNNNNNVDQVDTIDLAKVYGLVEREVEVLDLLVKRYPNQEIAEALFISRNTVKFHVKNIYIKMNIKTRQEAVDKLGQS
ncbi:MAG: signal transduction histidine kinase/DNA-binding NarL/FixJ family response regulator [Roseivirga sp.]|jgi:signal transduction histidine kinase/DNA-binding NarL/FixJ family response regulator/ligand-binding sensor domain-containing protein